MATDHISKLVQIQPAGTAKPESSMPLAAAREKLSDAKGPKYWRTLEELSNEPGFAEMVEREFPRLASEWTDNVSRRNFLKLASASLALAGLSACTKQPEEAIVPYVEQPEDLIPGKPMYFATARPSAFGAQPLLVKSVEYRPIKVEGNPDHPLSKGATDLYSQASVLDLYDPDRAQTVWYNGGLEQDMTQKRLPGARTWGEFLNDLRQHIAPEVGRQGAGLRLLTETVTSPTLADQIRDVLKQYPQMRWYQYEGVNRDAARTGSRMAFGQYVEPQYDLTKADVVVSLDADFLGGPYFPNFLKLARDFASRRSPRSDNPKSEEMSRFYVVESQSSPTGAKADHRLAIRASDVERFASALAGAVGAGGGGSVDQGQQKFLEALAKDLKAANGRSVVIPGEQQSANVHVLAAAINQALGNVGKTVTYSDPVELQPTEQTAGLKELVADMNAGKVSVLVMVGGNPSFDAPNDIPFAAALDKVAFRAMVSTHKNETSQHCHWHVPLAHYLESWSDARAFDGTASIVQPLIEPLYGGKTAHEVVAAFTENPGLTAYDAVRAYWQKQNKGSDFESWWRKSLHDGLIPNTAAPAKTVSAKAATSSNLPSQGMEVVLRPDPSIFDGRYNNNGWLQETPKPITKLTWDNAALMSLNTYQNVLKLETWRPGAAPMVKVAANGNTLILPAMIVPGFPDNTITVHLGYGRRVTGRVGTGAGRNAYVLRSSSGHSSACSISTPTADEAPQQHYMLALTQQHHLIDNPSANGPVAFLADPRGDKGTTETGNAAQTREIVRVATLEEYKEKGHEPFADEPFYKGANEHEEKRLDDEVTLFGEVGREQDNRGHYFRQEKNPGDENYYYHWTDDPGKRAAHQWGMAIDMNSCVGCNSCVVACVAENNIAIVGKDQVYHGRQMYWLRIDTYFEGSPANPRAYFQPLPCMQCENAPCEPVCPVGATVHSPEGLNNMVYNRCVGTRYCSNNCPYKVRRFNFLLYSDWDTQSLYPARNPDVSVRSRGVMEKCTYCVQRITAARIAAEKEDRRVRDGEVVTACQQACPTDAIVFGDIADPNSRVTRLKKVQRNYALLAELNTRPRTTYLGAVRNPSEEIEPKFGNKESHVG